MTTETNATLTVAITGIATLVVRGVFALIREKQREKREARRRAYELMRARYAEMQEPPKAPEPSIHDVMQEVTELRKLLEESHQPKPKITRLAS